MQINNATCKIAYPRVAIGRLALMVLQPILVGKLEHIHHTQKFLHENIRSLTKNQLHNRVFMINCWLDANQ